MFAPLQAGDGATAFVGATSRPKLVPIVPVPADAPACAWRHPKHGAPVAKWPYYDAEGRLLACAARVEYVDKDGEHRKDVLPITYAGSMVSAVHGAPARCRRHVRCIACPS